MRTHPEQPERFEARVKRLSNICKLDLPPGALRAIMKSECQLVVEAWYGGKARAGLSLVWQSVVDRASDLKTRMVLWVTDAMGWTRLYYMPETETHHGYWHRHGRHCSGSPNCHDMECVEKGVPR